MAKGITSAYFPLAATVVSEEIFAAFPADPASTGPAAPHQHVRRPSGRLRGGAENIAIMEEEGLRGALRGDGRAAARAAARGAQRPPARRRHPRARPPDRHRAGRRQGDARAGPARRPRRRSSRPPSSAGCCSAATSTPPPAWTTCSRWRPPLSLTDDDADHIVEALSGAFAETDAPAPPAEAADRRERRHEPT